MSIFEDIKDKLDVIQFIKARYPEIDIRKEGNVYKMLCPFHNEKTPSFTIFENGRYKCFGGCGASGDIFDFVQQMENVDNKDASRILGEFVGISVQFTPPNPHWEAYKDEMTQHNRRYYNNLTVNNDALHYLKADRGLTDESILEFRIGLVPDNEQVTRRDLLGIGGRIAFPILEQKAEINGVTTKAIGMGYRTLQDEDPKYKNDKNIDDETDPRCGVFVKSKVLYGFSKAKASIINQKFAYITEGYLDVISMHQAGFSNTVGLLTASMTEAQCLELKKFTSTLVIFLDGDKAGISGLRRMLPMLLQHGFKVHTVMLEFGMDPADLCVEYDFNWKMIKSYMDTAIKPAVQAIVDLDTQAYVQYVERARLSCMENLYPLINQCSNEGEEAYYKDYLRKKLDIN